MAGSAQPQFRGHLSSWRGRYPPYRNRDGRIRRRSGSRWSTRHPRAQRTRLAFDARPVLYRLLGVDLTQIGLDSDGNCLRPALPPAAQRLRDTVETFAVEPAEDRRRRGDVAPFTR